MRFIDYLLDTVSHIKAKKPEIDQSWRDCYKRQRETTEKILAYLEAHGPQTTAELAPPLGYTKAGLFSLMYSLEERNLVRRIKCEGKSIIWKSLREI